MNRKSAIHYLQMLIELGGIDDIDERGKQALEMAINSLKVDEAYDLMYENPDGWIPVTEKLPKDHEEVLIYLSTNRITIGLYNSHVLPLKPYKPIGWGVNAQTAVHNFCSDDVIAWMPLPEPYKAGSEDKK